MSKWGTIIVEGIDDNGPRHYPLDDKERNVIKFPKKKKRVNLYKNYYEHQEKEEEEKEELLDVGVQTEKTELPHIDELLSKI